MLSKTDLSELEASVYELLGECMNADVAIANIYRVAYPQAHYPVTNRARQQRVGPIIGRINKKLPEGHRIEPGLLKRTYRLNTKYKA